MLAFSLALPTSPPRYQSEQNAKLCALVIDSAAAFDHDVARSTYFVDMDWLFEEDCSRDPGII